MELIKALPATPLWIIAVALAAYLARNLFEKALDSRFLRSDERFKAEMTRAEDRIKGEAAAAQAKAKGEADAAQERLKADLALSEKRVAAALERSAGLRGLEQDELVAFRVAVERWEYFLQTGIGDLLTNAETTGIAPAAFGQKDQTLFGDVRLAAVKASIFLRSAELEGELLSTITGIRHLYYPLLQTALPELIEVHGRMQPLLDRMKRFEASGGTDLAAALTASEGERLIAMRHEATAVFARFAEALVAQYLPIAEQLSALKDKINVHLYRPVAGQVLDN